MVESIINGASYTDLEKSMLRIGVDVLPSIPKDTTDRNRTSPVAFTGNKFEFRMLGSAQSIAGPNIVLNTIMAEELGKFADVLENAPDFDTALHDLVRDALTSHQRIIFNGNGYSEEWPIEAEKRGLSNLRSTAEALPAYISPKNLSLVTKRGIFTEAEFIARYKIHLETYAKILHIEAMTCVDMLRKLILPAASKYAGALSQTASGKAAMGVSCKAEKALLARLSAATDRAYDKCEKLAHDIEVAPTGTVEDAANYYHSVILPQMDSVREDADELERLTDKSYWPYPTYSDLLFY